MNQFYEWQIKFVDWVKKIWYHLSSVNIAVLGYICLFIITFVCVFFRMWNIEKYRSAKEKDGKQCEFLYPPRSWISTLNENAL